MPAYFAGSGKIVVFNAVEINTVKNIHFQVQMFIASYLRRLNIPINKELEFKLSCSRK